eukprot:1327004-Amphidinium_carterae.2
MSGSTRTLQATSPSRISERQLEDSTVLNICCSCHFGLLILLSALAHSQGLGFLVREGPGSRNCRHVEQLPFQRILLEWPLRLCNLVLGESFEGEDVAKLLEEADMLKDGRISYRDCCAYLIALPDGQLCGAFDIICSRGTWGQPLQMAVLDESETPS